MIPIHTKLWAAIQLPDKKWDTPECIMEVPEQVMVSASKMELIRDLQTWHYEIVGDEVWDPRGSKKKVASIKQVSIVVDNENQKAHQMAPKHRGQRR